MRLSLTKQYRDCPAEVENVYVTLWQIYQYIVYQIVAEHAKFYGRYDKNIWVTFYETRYISQTYRLHYISL